MLIAYLFLKLIDDGILFLHCFLAVEPFSGATTGTGGRIRDVQATGRGAHVVAGTAGYSFGNCLIPGRAVEFVSFRIGVGALIIVQI